MRHETSWNVIQPALGEKPLADISAFDLERYRRDRKKAGKSDVTINRELAFLRNLYSMAITWGKATENPVKKIKFAREKNQRIRFLTPEEEQRLLEQCGPQLRPLVVTALHTGFRSSELLSLTWRDVDFQRKTITVRAAYAKNGESHSVPMNEVLLSTLKICKINHPLEEQVFRTHRGTLYRSYRSAFEQAVRNAKIEDFTFHDLRHTFASRLAMAGVDLPTLQKSMGHKDIKMTLRYTHLSSDHKRRAVTALVGFGERVPSIFTTEYPSQNVGSSQVIDFTDMGR